MLTALLFFSAVLVALGLNDQQYQLVKALMGPLSGIDPFVTVVDAPISGQVAYTSPDLKRVYVDFKRLEQTPKTAWNVMRHEFAHTKGATHGDGSPEMSYAVHTDPWGRITEDVTYI